MLAIINDILDISKLEAGQVELDTTLFDLREAIADVCAAPRAEAVAKGVAFEIEVAPELPHALRGDARRIQQILLNLVANAVKFTREGSVTVRAAAPIVEPGRVAVELSVTDTGIGIEPDLLVRMFDPFAQAEVSTTRNYGGTGLGLAIVRELVELMGGSVSAASEPGRGSTFTVALALEVAGTSASVAGPDVNGDPPVPAWPTPPRVLVAEDSAVNQIVAARLLERCGCEVQLAGDGREALAALEREQFAAVLMDCQMPLLDGYATTIAAARARGRNRSPHTGDRDDRVCDEGRPRALPRGRNGRLHQQATRAPGARDADQAVDSCGRPVDRQLPGCGIGSARVAESLKPSGASADKHA